MFINNPIVEIFLNLLRDNDIKWAHSLKRICRTCYKFVQVMDPNCIIVHQRDKIAELQNKTSLTTSPFNYLKF